MRLTERQRNIIRETTKEIFGIDAEVKLFGSRVDDKLKGGDIDLLIECQSPLKDVGLFSAKLVALLQQRIGDQKIDVLCVWPGIALSPAHESAVKNGVSI